MASQISSKIIADSTDGRGNRITTYILTYPRMIHAEVMTHRMFSRNAASSRAIPFDKMVKMVIENPFIPIAWQKDHKGMQGVEYYTDPLNIAAKQDEWLIARNHAVNQAKQLSSMGVTKQLCNRLLEPFMWYTCLVTATEYDNFFELRCPQYTTNLDGEPRSWKSRKDFINTFGKQPDMTDEYFRNIDKSYAEIHIQALAESMWDARNESNPDILQPGEWHIPFGDQFDIEKLDLAAAAQSNPKDRTKAAIKVAIARCARLSYMTFENEIDYVKDIALHDTLLKSKHMSPFEHCARVMDGEEYIQFDRAYPRVINGAQSNYFVDIDEGWCNNFRGFVQYRYLVENNQTI